MVRYAGHVTSNATILTLVRVKAPSGVRVSGVCRGRGCPRRSRGAQALRRRGLGHLKGSYRPGAVIEIRVTRKGRIGKYTRIRILKHKPPTRLDACLFPASRKPRRCPSA